MPTKQGEGTEKDEDDPQKAKMRIEFDALHAEMEVANYAVNHYGRSRRKVSRQESKLRTIKRKSLEVQDDKVSAVKANQRKRMRGSRAALEDDVVQGSLIFGSDPVGEGEDSDSVSSDKLEAFDAAGDQESDEEEVGRYNLYAEELNIDIDGEDSDSDDEERPTKKSDISSNLSSRDNPIPSRVKAASDKYAGKTIAKTMYKMKNFKSYRMAQRHGEALGAHARGLNVSAVNKLKDVATAAPVAPQVYSSLGLVYESMLREETEKSKRIDRTRVNNNQLEDKDVETLQGRYEPIVQEEDPDNLKERIKLARKAFGSYHVAALLCKMDYSLWTRAGDAALSIAHLHSQCLIVPPTLDDESGDDEEKEDGQTEQPTSSKVLTPEEYLHFHTTERFQWLEEAKEDFQSADNLRPPGISVPSKLAYTQMELGNISEALTILTDLKSKSQKEIDSPKNTNKRNRTELDRSCSAWLLYADLMLIIGHECRQWNRGIQTNENYMFRRWLRKYSNNFDWQERRFQALCMALEAAVGSKACTRLVMWIKERTRVLKSKGPKDEDESRWQVCDTYEMDRKIQQHKASLDKDGKESGGDTNDVPIIENKMEATVDIAVEAEPLSLERLNKNFNQDRSALVCSHQDRLSSFDEATQTLDLDSEELALREIEKATLVTKQRKGLIDLAVKYHEDKTHLIKCSDSNCTEVQEKDLPLSATCAIVTDIAVQLVKQCLAMNLYHAGTLACEAVSSYLKERACRVEDRTQRWKRFEERQELNGKSVLQLDKEAYDTMADGESDSEDSVVILSDDEDFECPAGKNIILMMKKGVLPPELQVLYGLSLLSEGNCAFIAVKMLSALHDLDQNTREDFDLKADNFESDTVSLRLFRRAMVEPMSKLDAFAFAADILKKVEKEDEWAERILPIFQGYIDDIEDQEIYTLLKDTAVSKNIITSVKKGNCVKVLLSTLRMKVGTARNLSTSSDPSSLKNASAISMAVVESIYLFKDALWSTTPDGNPTPDTVEMLNILSSAFSVTIICLDPSDNNNLETLQFIIEKMKVSVALICRVNFHDLYSSKSYLQSESWRYFPIPSSWQSDEYSAMSRSAYNLSVASAVSSFSGWEKDEFTLNLLKRSRKDTFFGIQLQGKQVAGFLNNKREGHLTDLWHLVEDLIPTLSSLDFENAVSNAKQVEWYKKAMMNLESNFKDVPIAAFGEDSALNILFIFAHIALLLAKEEEDELKEEALIKHALSIILPPTQFCLDQSLWDSDLGVKGTDENAEWQIFAAGDSTFKASTNAIKPLKKALLVKTPLRQKQNAAKHSTSNQMTKSPFSKIIKISAEVMLREWNGKETFEDSDEDDDEIDRRLNKWTNSFSAPSQHAMKKLDYSIQKLRHCATINSLQKASLQVSLSLLDVAATKECRNPFLCLNQAAVFSAQGPKGGNNDEPLKKPLPKETDCSPEDALQVLGRADCLRAIHFTSEALFLCSYAARVCCLHRDKKELHHPWTPKWRIIGIMVYTISVGIDSIIFSIMQGDARKTMLDSWEKSIKAEIGRGRSDAIAMQKALGRFHSSLARQKNSPLEAVVVNEEEEEASWNEEGDNNDEEGEDNDEEGDVHDEEADDNDAEWDDNDEEGEDTQLDDRTSACRNEEQNDARVEKNEIMPDGEIIEDQVSSVWLPSLSSSPIATVDPVNDFSHISAVEI